MPHFGALMVRVSIYKNLLVYDKPLKNLMQKNYLNLQRTIKSKDYKTVTEKPL